MIYRYSEDNTWSCWHRPEAAAWASCSPPPSELAAGSSPPLCPSAPHTLCWASLYCVFYLQNISPLQWSELLLSVLKSVILQKNSSLRSVFGSQLPVIYSCVPILRTFIKVLLWNIYMTINFRGWLCIRSVFIHHYILAFTRIPWFLLDEINNIPKFLYVLRIKTSQDVTRSIILKRSFTYLDIKPFQNHI